MAPKSYYGIKGFFEWLETKTYKMHVRVYLSRYRAYVACDACGGSRFQPSTLLYRLRGANIAEIASCSIEKLSGFFGANGPRPPMDPAASLLVSEIRSRLQFLMAVGLHYLSLDRQSQNALGRGSAAGAPYSRSGILAGKCALRAGRAKRGASRTGPEETYGPVEPARDDGKQRRDGRARSGNDPVLRRSDRHGAGWRRKGGRSPVPGTAGGTRAIVEEPYRGVSLRSKIGFAALHQPPDATTHGKKSSVRGARENNLKAIDATVPLGLLVGVSGVSGSGKSTLVEKTLYHGWLRKKGRAAETPGLHDEIAGAENVSEIVLVDQQPVGRYPEGEPADLHAGSGPVAQDACGHAGGDREGFFDQAFFIQRAGGKMRDMQRRGIRAGGDAVSGRRFRALSSVRRKRFKEEVLDIKLRGI